MKNEEMIANHSIILVYPFLHALDQKDRILLLEKLQSSWQPWWNRLDDGHLVQVLDDTFFFLPYIRKLLFPETIDIGTLAPDQQFKEAQSVKELPLTNLFHKYAKEGLIRLNFRQALSPRLQKGHLLFERSDQNDRVTDHFQAPFLIEWIDAAVFPGQIGFLLLKVRIDEQKIGLRRLVDFLYYCRLVHPPSPGWQLAAWKFQESALSFESRDLVNYLLQGFGRSCDYYEPDPSKFLQLRERNREDGSFTGSEFGQIYGENFSIYFYGCLSGKNKPRARSNSALFKNNIEKNLYELATHSSTNDPGYKPHPDFIHSLFEQHHIAIWNNWQGLALQNNVVFLGTEEQPFTINVLPRNVDHDYFYLYLVSLFQKTWLSHVSGQIAIKEASMKHKLHDARALFDNFIHFQNHYWFNELTRKPIGMEIYQRFRSGLALLPLYDSLHEQIDEIRNYFESKYERRTNFLIFLLTVFVLPIGAFCSLFGGALIKKASWVDFGVTILTFYMITAFIWALVRHLKKV